jgi:glycosyltransferase involved in cell wall biosynthesis
MISSRRTRVLFFNDSSRIAGAEKSLALLAGNLDPTLFETCVVCPPGAYGAYLSERGIRVEEAPLHYYRKNYWLRYFRSLLSSVRLVRRFRPDIIHCNSYRAAHWGIPLAALLSIPTLCHIRDCRYTRFSSLLMRRAPEQVRYVAVSRAVQHALERVGVDSARIDVVYNGTDMAAFNPDVIPARLPEAGEAGLIIGVFGRIEERKRVIDVVEALNRLPGRLAAHLLIVGESWTETGARVEEEIRSRVETLGLTSRVTFTGYREDVPSVMAAVDMVVVPSVDEPFARVILEAMSLAKPIIGTTSGGTPEMLEDGESGLLVPPGNPPALAAAIASLADPDLARRLGENARSRALKLFTVGAHVSRIQQIYDLAQGLIIRSVHDFQT